MDRHLISFAFGIIRNVPAPHPLGCMFVYMRHGHSARLVCRDRPVGCRRAGGAHQQSGRLCGHRGGRRHGAGGHPGPGHGQPLCRIRAAHQRSRAKPVEPPQAGQRPRGRRRRAGAAPSASAGQRPVRHRPDRARHGGQRSQRPHQRCHQRPAKGRPLAPGL